MLIHCDDSRLRDLYDLFNSKLPKNDIILPFFFLCLSLKCTAHSTNKTNSNICKVYVSIGSDEEKSL